MAYGSLHSCECWLVLVRVTRLMGVRCYYVFQRQRLRAVPVSECSYTWKNKKGRYWVYGQEMTIYSPDYPQKYCCGCSLV